ncbi:MAG: sugar phosphate isomerase/epimerase [Armatimonadetes bacterium]|nr:sugar phosphate isomerase/epimerase [Armatimonadota bacterium]
MSKVPIGLQLYSVRQECANDLKGTLARVAEIGYVAAEPWGYGGDKVEWMGMSAEALRAEYDANDLTCCGMHISTGALIGDNLKRTVELNATLGNRFLIIAADSARMASLAGIEELAGILNTASDALQSAPSPSLPRGGGGKGGGGMFCGYHAHGFDFATVEGDTAWNHLFRRTKHAVIMQMDVGNCANGGGDPYGPLREFVGRARTVHLKEWGVPGNPVPGEGVGDWPEIFRLCETLHKTEWYVVEQEDPSGLGFDTPARALAALKAMGK